VKWLGTLTKRLAGWAPTGGQELVGLGLLAAGLWLWSPPLALCVVGALLVLSALLKGK